MRIIDLSRQRVEPVALRAVQELPLRPGYIPLSRFLLQPVLRFVARKARFKVGLQL